MALNDTPQATQALGVTQPLIRTNFQNIDMAFSVDHIDYAEANQGQHNRITFPVQALQPSFSAGTNGMYNLAYTPTAQNEIYVHKQNNAAAIDIPMTASILGNTNVTNVVTNNTWGYIPSGLIMASGFGTGTGSTVVTINLGTVTWTNILGVVVTPFTGLNNAATYITNLVGVTGVHQFTVFISSASTGAPVTGQFSWMAILN